MSYSAGLNILEPQVINRERIQDLINSFSSIGASENGSVSRRGFSDEDRALIKKAYRTFFKSKLNRGDALEKIKTELNQTQEIKEIIEFIESSNRGII